MFLYWIYWSHAKREKPGRFYESIFATQFWKEWFNNLRLSLEIKYKYEWNASVWYQTTLSSIGNPSRT